MSWLPVPGLCNLCLATGTPYNSLPNWLVGPYPASFVPTPGGSMTEGHRRPTWISMKDKAQQCTGTPGKSCTYCIHGPNLSILYMLVLIQIVPYEELFCLHKGGSQAWTNVQVAQDLPWNSRPTNSHCSATEDTYECPGLLWKETVFTAVSVAQPHWDNTVPRSQWTCKGERE